jgi:hypothetical protein
VPIRASNWSAESVISCGETHEMFATYSFVVDRFVRRGPAFGKPVVATRLVFSGGDLSARCSFNGKLLIVHSLCPNALSISDELLAASVDGVLTDHECEMIWLLLSFISGNCLGTVSIEFYDINGDLISVEHQRGGGPSLDRKIPFKRGYGSLTSSGMTSLAEGFLRLVDAGFPIAIVVHHLTESNVGNIDTDAQRLSLAIYTVIEAWNRAFGFDFWIDDEIWEPYISEVRKLMRVTYDDVGSDVKANIASCLRWSNKTTISWRQSKLFEGLGIDVTTEDNKRVLKFRDELLHNGYFLKRWTDLSDSERQERFDDVARLRNLVHQATCARFEVRKVWGFDCPRGFDAPCGASLPR